MSTLPQTLHATFENGVFRPDEPVSLAPRQRVTLVVQLEEELRPWPDDVAEIYAEIAEEDRRLADAMFPAVRETWPQCEEQP